MFLLAILLCAASGYLIVQLAWPRFGMSSDLLLRLSLSVGFGLGFFSVIFFVDRAVNLKHLLTLDIVCFVLLLGCHFFLRRSLMASNVPQPATQDLVLPAWLHRILIAGFAITVAAALYSTVALAIRHPHGSGWDAFAIWNLHARFLFRGGSNWREGLSSLLPWSHPDYPLLLPAAVAHFWAYLGHENPAVPSVIGLTFTFSTLGLLYSSLARLRGDTMASLGLITLASTPFFITQGSAQYADVPLSFFFLASVALRALYEQPSNHGTRQRGFIALAGIALGFAAWTKNEGMLFLFATMFALILAQRRFRNESTTETADWHALAILLLGAAPMLGVIFWFKHLAPPGDLFSSRVIMLHKMLTPARYWAIFSWHAKEYFRFGEWWPIPATLLLPALALVLPRRDSGQPNPSLRLSIWTLTLTLGGYFLIYVVTPNQLYWHLRFSLNRLFLQLWPSVVFLFFSSVSLRFASQDPTQAQRNCI